MIVSYNDSSNVALQDAGTRMIPVSSDTPPYLLTGEIRVHREPRGVKRVAVQPQSDDHAKVEQTAARVPSLRQGDHPNVASLKALEYHKGAWGVVHKG